MTDNGTPRAWQGMKRRDVLGRRVREVWIAWAERQPDPKPSWLVPYDELDEADKEADRCIGSALWGDGFAAGLDYTDSVAEAMREGRQPNDR